MTNTVHILKNRDAGTVVEVFDNYASMKNYVIREEENHIARERSYNESYKMNLKKFKANPIDDVKKNFVDYIKLAPKTLLEQYKEDGWHFYTTDPDNVSDYTNEIKDETKVTEITEEKRLQIVADAIIKWKKKQIKDKERWIKNAEKNLEKYKKGKFALAYYEYEYEVREVISLS